MTDLLSREDRDVLEAIRGAGPEFIKGTVIAARMGVSKQAISARVRRLRRHGFAIDGVPLRSYRMRMWRTS